MRRSIGLARGRRSTIGLRGLGAGSAAIGGGWRLLGPRGSRWWRLGGYTRHWQHGAVWNKIMVQCLNKHQIQNITSSFVKNHRCYYLTIF